MISLGGLAARLGGVTLSLAVVVLGGACLFIWLDWIHTLRDAHANALRLVHVLNEQTERTVQAADLILTGLAETLKATPELSKHDPAFRDKMRALVQSSPFIRGLYVTGPDGFLTHATGHPNSPRASAVDRDYFMAHAARADLGLFVGKPLKSRRVGTWFIGLSRRLSSADGSFAGVVVAAVEPRYFERFYGDLGLGGNGSIALFRRDGTLLARHPHVEWAVGMTYGSYPPFRNDQLETTSRGTLETRGAIAGSAQVVAYSTVEGTPLVVSVGLDKGTVLADWRHHALVTLGSAFGIALLGAASLTLLIQRRRQRAAVEQHLAQAQRLDAASQMVAGIVHDFRNLLTVLAIGADMLRRGVTDATLERVLDEIDAAVERGTALASKLLAFSRQQELELEVVDVNQLVLALQPLMRSAAGSGERLQLDLAPEVWPCRLDRTEFDRALLNLIVNARDAMPNGGEVRVATANDSWGDGVGRAMLPRGDYVRVSVADAGQGMPQGVARRAMEPFFTTKGEAGTGLGLSQVYGFVRQVGGDLRIKSVPGAGTTVDLFFPRCAPVRSRPAAEVAHSA